MASQQDANKGLIRDLYGSLMAHGDTATAMTLLPPNFIDHDIPGLGTGGPEDLIQAVLAVRASFPISPRNSTISSPKRIGWPCALRRVAPTPASHSTAFLLPGRRSAGKIHIFRCASGKIAEHRGVFDLLSILQQLGALPAA